MPYGDELEGAEHLGSWYFGMVEVDVRTAAIGRQELAARVLDVVAPFAPHSRYFGEQQPGRRGPGAAGRVETIQKVGDFRVGAQQFLHAVGPGGP